MKKQTRAFYSSTNSENFQKYSRYDDIFATDNANCSLILDFNLAPQR